MILILSRDDDGHVPMVTDRLAARGVAYMWFDPGRFPRSAEIRVAYDSRGLTARVLVCDGASVDLGDVTAVWYRRPGRPEAAPEVHGESEREWVSRESQEFLAGLWETLDCLWVPGKPQVVESGYNKVSQLALAGRLGFRIPRTLVANSPGGCLEFYGGTGGQLVSKNLRPFYLRRQGEQYDSYTHRVRRRDLAAYASLRYAPAILQEYVPKSLELRVTVVGSQVFAAEIRSQESRLTRDDWRHYDNDRATYAPHDLPSEVRALCVSLLDALHLCFGTLDFVLTPDGEYVFLELNPNGQWGWVEDLTGMPIAEALTELLILGGGALPRQAGGADGR